MFELNRWAYQMDYYESIKNDAIYNGKIRNLNALEYNEYIDLKRCNKEQIAKETFRANTMRKSRISSKKYA